MNVGVLEAILRLKDVDFTSKLREAQGQLASTSERMKSVGQSMARTGRTLSLAVTTPIVGIGVAALRMAVDAEEAANKFDVVMGPAASRLRAEFEQLHDIMPLTTAEMEAQTAGIQDMLVPMGIAREEAAGMSLDMLKLAGDISSFNNVAQAKVLEDFKSALAGQSEPMRKYGIDTRITTLEQIAFNAGIIEAGEKMDQTAMAQAVLIQATRQSADAIGDQARTVDSASNQMRLMWRDIRDLGMEIGQALIPVVKEVVPVIREWVQWFTELSPAVKTTGLVVSALAAAVGPLLVVIGTLIRSVGVVAGAFTAKTAATVADTAATTANTAANTANVSSLGRVAGALGKTTAALGALWAGWQAGSFINDQIEKYNVGVADMAERHDWLRASIVALGVATNVDWMKAYGADVSLTAEELENINQVQQDFNASVVSSASSVDTATGSYGEYEDKVMLSAEAMEALAYQGMDPVLARLEQLIGAGAGDLDDAVDKMADLASNTQEATTELARIAESALPPVNAEVANLKRVMGEYGVVLPDVNKVTADLNTLWQSGQVPARQMADIVRRQYEELERLGVMTDKAREEFKRLEDEVRDTGGILDRLTGSFKDLWQGISSGQGIGGMLKNIGAGIADGLGNLIAGGINQLIQMGVDLAWKGLKKLGSAIWGGIKSLFGGPSEEELQARDTVKAMNDAMLELLDTTQLAEAGGERWKQTNIAQRDIILAMGGSIADVEAIWARFQNAAKDPAIAAEMESFWSQKLAEVQAAMEKTGLTMTELRNTARKEAKKLGITVKEAFDAIADGTIDTMKKATKATSDEIEVARAGYRKALKDVELAQKELSKATDAESREQAFKMIQAAEFAAAEWKKQLDGLKDKAADASDAVADKLKGAADSISDTFRDMEFEIPINFSGGKGLDIGAIGGEARALPSFHSGGVVPGPVGSDQLVVAKGGERFLPPGGGKGEIHIHTHLNNKEVAHEVVKVTPEVLAELGIG